MSYTLMPLPSQGPRPTPADGTAPLVLVHGWGGSHTDFLPMSLYLRKHGRRRLFSVRFGVGESIPERVERLRAFLSQVRRLNPDRPMDVVAHSLGGIVARLALAEPGLEGSVGTLLTLGSPHGGSSTANYFPNEVARALRPDAWLVHRLRHLQPPKGVRLVSFWSANDIVVPQARAAAFPGARQVNMSPFTHYGYLVDGRSWAAVERALRGAQQAGVRGRPASSEAARSRPAKPAGLGQRR